LQQALNPSLAAFFTVAQEPKNPRSLRARALAVALAAAYPALGNAADGVAQFSAGTVTLSRGSGQPIPLAKGQEIATGDLLATGPDGRVQVRFSDGGLVSLAAQTQLLVRHYADVGEPSRDRFLVDLLQGGMRAITGMIGKRNSANYKVKTPRPRSASADPHSGWSTTAMARCPSLPNWTRSRCARKMGALG
jgi:hypothetical protein